MLLHYNTKYCIMISMRTHLASVIILAGGIGQRLGQTANGQQKCLLPIDEKPVLGHVLEGIREALGSVQVIISVSYKAGDVRNYVNRHAPYGIKTEFMFDSGGSKLAQIVAAAEDKVAESFMVVAGDIVTKPKIFRAIYESAQGSGIFASTALSPRLEEVDSHALCKVLPDGRVADILSPPPAVPPQGYLREMTIRGLNKRFFEYTRRYPDQPSIPLLLKEAVKDGEYIAGEVYYDHWIHLGYPPDLAKSMKHSPKNLT